MSGTFWELTIYSTLGALVVPLLAACSSVHSVQMQWVGDGGVMISGYTSHADAEDSFSQWQLNCKSPLPADCPNEVGQLIALDGSAIYQCTATLIADDTVITNSHCFGTLSSGTTTSTPAELCQNAAIVFANQSPLGREVAECDKVLIKSEIGAPDDTADYMILKLKKPLRRGYLEMSQEGMPDQEVLTISKVNPLPKDSSAELESAHCTVLHGTIGLPQSVHDDDPIEIVKGCQVVHGNSGSALRTSGGKIVGLAFATTEPSDHESDLTKKMIEIKGAWATNATCIDYSMVIPTAKLAAHCTQKAGSEGIDTSGQFKTLVHQVESEGRAKSASLDPHFVYSIGNDPKDPFVLIYEPDCFSIPTPWIKEFSDSKGSFLSAATLNPVSLRWQVRQEIDNNLKPVWTAEPLPPVQTVLTFNPLELSGSWHSEVTNQLHPIFDVCSN